MAIERAKTLVDNIYTDCDSILDPGDLIEELGALARESDDVREFLVATVQDRTRVGPYASVATARRWVMVSLARTKDPAMAAEFGKQLMLPDDGSSTEIWDIRNAAAFALGRLGCPEAIPVLEKASAAGHAYESCRDALKSLKEEFGGDDDSPERSQADLDADLLEATEKGDRSAVQELLAAGASVEARHPEWRQTPLSIASWAKGAADAVYVEILDALVAKGATTQVGNKDGWSPLHLASYHGLVPRVRFLVEHGADVTASISNGHFAGQCIGRSCFLQRWCRWM